MRASLGILLLLLIAPPRDFPDTWLEGTIGPNLRVRMFIGDAGWPLTEGLQGMYFYTSRWEPIPLEGEALPSGGLRIYEGDPELAREARAVFDLKRDSTG